MATASSQSADNATNFTDCPYCGDFCLGATILPCGHVLCRKCLRQLLQNKKPCSICEQSLPTATEQTFSQLTQLFSAELVLHDLVNKRLQDLGQQSCHVCQNRDAAMICQDCGEMYCDACSAAHRKMRMSSDHVQQPLPHTLCNAPPGARATTGFRYRPRSRTSTVSEDSITNLPRAPTTKTKPDRQWIEHQVQLLKRTTRDVKEVALAAQNVSTLALQLAEEAKRKAEILDIYADKLSNAKINIDEDGNVCVSGLTDADVKATVKTQDLQKRLRDVRKGCRQYDVMDKLRTESSKLTQKADKSSDPITATPRRAFETTAVTDQDTVTPYISDVLTTHDGRLLIADPGNKMIKVAARSLSGENTLSALTLGENPWFMSLLSDGLVAVTASNKTIYLVDVSSHVTVKSQFKTSRQYYGVTDGPDDDTLLVIRGKDHDGPAGVDVIRHDGSLVRTVIDGDTLTGLEKVYTICVVDGHVLIPDVGQHCVYRVEVTSGRLVDTLTHPDLKAPIQVVVDEDRNVYIVCVASYSVVVRSCEGEWRRLLHGPQHGSGDNSYPRAMCLTQSGIVVAWNKFKGDGGLHFGKVIEYELVW